MKSFETWQLSFVHRPIVGELMPEEKHVSVAALVRLLWCRQVNKMDSRGSVDVEPVESLDTFVTALSNTTTRKRRLGRH
ncbi:hypothetical protein VUR80DRAFT_6488 [Thermomyces stellatus]